MDTLPTRKNEKVLHIGVNFTGHDSAVFIIDPVGREVFALATERLTGFKHDELFSLLPIRKFLAHKKINPEKIDKVIVAHASLEQKDLLLFRNQYRWQVAERKHFKVTTSQAHQEALSAYRRFKPLKKILNLAGSAWGLYILAGDILKRVIPGYRLTLDELIKGHLGKIFSNAEIETNYYDHQFCHALAAFLTSPFSESLVFTCDGYGDKNFSAVYEIKNGKIRMIVESACTILKIDHELLGGRVYLSFGDIYAYFTELLGFDPVSDPGKVEALAAYGSPDIPLYVDLMSIFSVDEKSKMMIFDQKKAIDIFSLENKKKLLATHKKEDVAAALQRFTEDAILTYLKFMVRQTGALNLCLSGGVAANVKLNMRIFEEVTKNLHISPAMADDGAAQGAIAARLISTGHGLSVLSWFKDQMPYFGSSYEKSDIRSRLDRYSAKINIADWQNDWPERAAEEISRGKILAVFHGKMEWGPRALGNRSILADARNPRIQDILNRQIKRRPYFQPFCPSMLMEEKNWIFENAYANKHMTCAFRIKKEFRDALPGAMHIDGTSRVQFVEQKDNPEYFRLLKKMKVLTGFGVVINTSFNKHGRTMVESPRDAIRDFLETDIDLLIIEGFAVTRKNMKD